jgi:hypothetical protein
LTLADPTGLAVAKRTPINPPGTGSGDDTQEVTVTGSNDGVQEVTVTGSTDSWQPTSDTDSELQEVGVQVLLRPPGYKKWWSLATATNFRVGSDDAKLSGYTNTAKVHERLQGGWSEQEEQALRLCNTAYAKMQGEISKLQAAADPVGLDKPFLMAKRDPGGHCRGKKTRRHDSYA